MVSSKARLVSRFRADSIVAASRQPDAELTAACFLVLLFCLLRGLRGPRDAPGIVLFLGLRNLLQCGLVGLLVHFRFLLVDLLFLAPGPLATQLGLRRRCDQSQDCHRDREAFHCLCLPVIPSLLSGRMMATASRQIRLPAAGSQQVLIAMTSELSAAARNLNRGGLKSADAADLCSCGVDCRRSAGAGGLRHRRQP